MIILFSKSCQWWWGRWNLGLVWMSTTWLLNVIQFSQLTCYVCGWAQGFKLAHSMPPHITKNANLAQWLRVLCYVIHSSRGCQFNSRSWISFFFQPLRGPTLNVESDWLVVMFTATGCHVDITTSQSDSRCAWFGCFSHNAHLLSFIHCVAPIVLSSLSKFSYNLEIIFFSLIFFSLASGLYFPWIWNDP